MRRRSPGTRRKAAPQMPQFLDDLPEEWDGDEDVYLDADSTFEDDFNDGPVDDDADYDDDVEIYEDDDDDMRN